MSRRRFPNKPHWQRAVDCAQRVCGTKGRAWRRKLEAHLGIERGQLRAKIDRPMDLDEQRDLDDRLAAFLRHHADLAYARVQRLDRHLTRLVETRNDREAARRVALDASAEWEWQDILIGSDIEEPMRQQFPELFLEKEAA